MKLKKIMTALIFGSSLSLALHMPSAFAALCEDCINDFEECVNGSTSLQVCLAEFRQCRRGCRWIP